MIFSSVLFLFYFLPAVLIGYLLSPKRFRNWWLIFASLFFYCWGEGVYAVFLFTSVVVTHLAVRRILHTNTLRPKMWLTLGIIINLAMLGVNKYGIFVVEQINTLLQLASVSVLPVPDIKLPLGISFFVFQAIAYLVDAYRREVTILPTFKETLLYISLFPQLIAGPIVRFTDIQADLRDRSVRFDDVVEGTRRFVRGLAKKVLIANQLALVADAVFALPTSSLTMTIAWVGILAYTFQIFFDFSGYSDMAIGLGRIFGFKFPENFDYPYISRSVQEFWRRWHMSLSSWIRDYVYIPLGGSRGGFYRTYVNLFIIFTLVGIWHGAGWAFILWGMWYGALMVLERAWLGNVLTKVPRILSHVYIFIVTIIGWTLFRSESLPAAFEYMQRLVGVGKTTVQLDPSQFYTPITILAAIAAIIGSVPWKRVTNWFDASSSGKALVYTLYLTLFVLSILHVGMGTYNPFIYFRF